jgi:hypothetical protein
MIKGPTTENTISTDVSYTVPTSETFKLSLELKQRLTFLIWILIKSS